MQAYVEGPLDGVAKTPEKRQQYLLTIKTKAEYIQRMVSQIFLFSKMDLDAYPVPPRELRLDDEIAALAQENGESYARKGLRIETELAPLCVLADPANPQYIQTVWGADYRFRGAA